jgi:hypothetical protein
MGAFPEVPFYGTTTVKYTALRFGLEPLDLGKTAVDKQFHSRDRAAAIRCAKHSSPSKFVRLAKPAERDCAGYHLAMLFTCVTRGEHIIQTGRINGSGADRIDTNPTMLELCGPSSRKRADGSLRCAVLQRSDLAAAIPTSLLAVCSNFLSLRAGLASASAAAGRCDHQVE